MVSKILSVTFLLPGALFCLPAVAADMSYPPAPSYEAPLPYDWSGFYVGAHGGLAFTEAPNPLADRNGIDAGVQAGYNFQVGPAIVGAEIEGSYLGDAEHKIRGGTVEEKWRAAVKARAGLSFDRTLVFGTAGYAMTEFEAEDGLRDGGGWEGGYLLGGGLEQGFAGGLSAKVEYNYVTTSDVETRSNSGASHTDIGSHVLKAGINYGF